MPKGKWARAAHTSWELGQQPPLPETGSGAANSPPIIINCRRV